LKSKDSLAKGWLDSFLAHIVESQNAGDERAHSSRTDQHAHEFRSDLHYSGSCLDLASFSTCLRHITVLNYTKGKSIDELISAAEALFLPQKFHKT